MRRLDRHIAMLMQNNYGMQRAVIEWYMTSAGLFSSTTTPTYTGPSAHWTADYQGVLQNMGGKTNSAGQAIPPLRNSRLDGTVMRDDQGTATAMVLEGSITNKVTARKRNPTDTTNVTKSGDAAAVLSVVDDTAALAAAGLGTICNTGKVYKLDNSAGTGAAAASFSGSTGNTNTHTVAMYVRGSGNVHVKLSAGAATPTALTSEYVRRTLTGTPAGASDTLVLFANAGAVVYFILPSLTETTVAPQTPIVDATDGLAAVTRSATRLQVPTASITGLSTNNWMWRSKVAVKALPGTDQAIWGDPTSGVMAYLRGADNKVVYRTGSYGNELVTMASFSTPAGATKQTVDFGGRTSVIKLTNTSTVGVTSNQTINTTAGKAYLVQAYVYAPSANTQTYAARVYSTELTTNIIYPTAEDAWQLVSRVFVAAGATTAINIAAGGAGGVSIGDIAYFSDVSVKEVKEVASAAVTLDDHYIGVSQSSTGASVSLNGTVTTDATATSDITWGTTMDIGSMNNASFANVELAEDTTSRLTAWRRGYDTSFFGASSW